MHNTGSRVHFWNHLLQTAELIETMDGPQTKAVIVEQLGTINEAFGDCADPVEYFEEYVVIRLSQAIHKALDKETDSAQVTGKTM